MDSYTDFFIIEDASSYKHPPKILIKMKNNENKTKFNVINNYLKSKGEKPLRSETDESYNIYVYAVVMNIGELTNMYYLNIDSHRNDNDGKYYPKLIKSLDTAVDDTNPSEHLSKLKKFPGCSDFIILTSEDKCKVYDWW